jgi:hypothetical protein
MPSGKPQQFSEDEVSNLKEIFDLFDKSKTGLIGLQDLEAIMQSLQRNAQEARSLLVQIRGQQEGDLDSIDFDEFLKLMELVENSLSKEPAQQAELLPANGSGTATVAADNKVLDFLRLLEEYRKKCEIEGNYQEAKKARAKFEELLRKETIRQKNNLRAAQEQELQNIEAA